MRTIFWISLGAILGANARYWLATLLNRASSLLPYGTLLINVTGSLILGFFMIWTSERAIADPRWRLLVAIGFCGGYTTFSSFAFETFALFEQGRWIGAISNLLLSNVVSLLAVLAGAALARSI